MRLGTRYALKLITLVVLCVVVVSALYSLQHRRTLNEVREHSTQVVNNALSDEIHRGGRGLVEALASSLFEPVALDDFEQITNITRSALELPSVIRIVVFDSQGIIINDGTETVSTYGTEISERLRLEILEKAQL